MVHQTNDRCSLYLFPDSIWIELCPANWGEVFKAEQGWGEFDLAYQWGTNGKYPVTALNDSTVIEIYSDCFQVKMFSTITFCHLIYTVCVSVLVCVYFVHVTLSLWSSSSLCFTSIKHHFCCWVMDKHNWPKLCKTQNVAIVRPLNPVMYHGFLKTHMILCK